MNFELRHCQSQVTQINLEASYNTDEFQLHTHVKDGTEFGGFIDQMVNKKLEIWHELQATVTLLWNSRP